MDRPEERPDRLENDTLREREARRAAERAKLEREMDWETEAEPATLPDAAAPDATRPVSISRGPTDDGPSGADVAGEAVGGLTGVVTGAAIGSAAGPVGTLVGGIAGALGGWWAGRAIAEAATTVTDEDDAWFRADYEAFGDRSDDWSWERARPVYRLGHLAARNPEWSSREWSEVEPELRRGWNEDVEREYGDWPTARRFAAAGYERERERARRDRR